MNQKVEKPSLTGQRIKTRKRDEKEKYDPVAFRDAVLQGFTEAGPDLEQISKFLDSAGSRLDYRRYAEPLLDVLFAGGILAPGGSLIQDGNQDKTSHYKYCIFNADDGRASLKAHYEVLYKLIRRYKYLEKSFDDELKKLVRFLRGFTGEEREKLARMIGICLANGLGNSTCLTALFEDYLIKDGLSAEFARIMFLQWLEEKDMQNLSASLKKAGIENKLMLLFPLNKQTQEHFETYFKSVGLNQIVEYQKGKANAEMRKGVQTKLEQMIQHEEPVKEMVILVKDHMTKNSIPEHDIIVMVWNTLMAAVEWNKKDELVAEQALKHLKQYSGLLAAFTESDRSEFALITKVQEYCYENMNFLKCFSKIVVLLYKTDVLGEDMILKWYRDAPLVKGKSIFLEQMKRFVEWLQKAEEESEDED